MTRGERNEGAVFCNYVKWCKERLRRDITRVTEIDTPQRRKSYSRVRARAFIGICAPVYTRYKKFDETSIQCSGHNEIFFYAAMCCFRNESSPPVMEITRLFNATVVRSLSPADQKGRNGEKEKTRSFPRDWNEEKQRFLCSPMCRGLKKKYRTIRY